MVFINLESGDVLSHAEFVAFVWDEAERQFNECHDDENWCDLSRDEQIEIYCEQYDHQLIDNGWTVD